MVLIPASKFHTTLHEVEVYFLNLYVDAFYMDKYEVTNAQYKKFVDTNLQWQKDHILGIYHSGYYIDYWNDNNYPTGKLIKVNLECQA